MHTKEQEDVGEKSFQLMITDIYTKTVMILKPPFLCRTIVVCLIACFVTSSYYTLTLWLPELFNRYAEFQEAYPNQTASVCTLKSARNVTQTVSQRSRFPDECKFHFFLLSPPPSPPKKNLKVPLKFKI